MDAADMVAFPHPEETRQYPPEQIRLYGHAACPALPPIRGMLERSSVSYDYINIHHDYEGRQRVLEINNGYASVPTLEFPDGTTLTEPSTGELSAKLKTLGYTVPFTASLIGNIRLIIIGAVIIYATLRFFEVL